MSKILDVLISGTSLIVLIIFLTILGPFLSIWAVNTLFHTGIEFTFVNWLAAAVLISMARGNTTSKKKD